MGESAKDLTRGKEDVDFTVELGGATTFKQSLAVVKIDGIISLVGAIGR
jgi:NADPH:quinone reductase-like Zn-dependent oxidoreductase